MKRTVPVVLAAIPILLAVPPGAAASPATQALEFETQCLDLDEGTVIDPCSGPEAIDAAWDVRVSYHADRPVRAVILQNRSIAIEIAHLEEALFDEVDASDIATAVFTRGVIDRTFDTSIVILVRTDLGAVFKIGNPSEGEIGLEFDCVRLSAGP